MTARTVDVTLDEALQHADYYGFIAVDQQMWSGFVKLAIARDAFRGFRALMGQLRGAGR